MEEQITDLKREITELKEMVGALTTTNRKLDNHIDFIQGVYEQFLPVLIFFQKIPQYLSKFIKSEPNPSLPPPCTPTIT